MRSGSLIFLIGTLFIILTDSVLYIQLKQYLNKRRGKILYGIHSLFFVLLILIYHFTISRLKGPEAYFWVGKAIGIIFLFYTPKLILLIFNIFSWSIGKINYPVCRIIRVMGWTISSLIFLIILFSITLGRYNYKIENVEASFNNLPGAFNDYKIVHLSDIHLGSYGESYRGIARLVDEVNTLDPDIIVFTGDMVNNFADEMKPWINTLSKLKAKDGKYAVTGNHDYGDYTQWPTKEDRLNNQTFFFKNMKDMGFQMLNNDYIPLIKGSDTIYLAGVENWGKPPFPRYGKLSETIHQLKGQFIVLLSHDPSHWRAEILNHNIPLTLSGHTHAMQMGIKIGKKEWSPAQYIYPEYDGLYRHDNKYLYVSRGQGYLGFPGRIGLRPVITEITLISSK